MSKGSFKDVKELANLILGVTDDEFDYAIDNVKAYIYYTEGGCYEFAKIIKYYFEDECEYVIRNDLDHVAILYKGQVYDAYDGLDDYDIKKYKVPVEFLTKKIDDFRLTTEDELNTFNFGTWKNIIFEGKTPSEALIKEINSIENIQIEPNSNHR